MYAYKYSSQFCPVYKSMRQQIKCMKIRRVNAMYLTLHITNAVKIRPQ
jgi:hypothetical protein